MKIKSGLTRASPLQKVKCNFLSKINQKKKDLNKERTFQTRELKGQIIFRVASFKIIKIV